MSSSYSKLSPYYTTQLNGSYLDIINFRQIDGETDDVKFEVTSQYEYRPDLLAYDLYGDVNLWWVFSIRNKDKIKDPIYDLFAGQTIYLPKLSTLRNTLGF
jgi:hypothetical protein